MRKSNIEWAIEANASSAQKHVLLMLAIHADERRRVLVPASMLAKMTGLSERTVTRARKELLKMVLIERLVSENYYAFRLVIHKKS